MTNRTPGVHNYCHIEILTNDPDTSANFHEKAFGWKIQRFGADMQNYIMYETTDGITGGFRKPQQGENLGMLTYIAVENVDKELAALATLGAKPVAPKQEVPGFGTMVVVAVPGGNVQALWQPAPRQ